MARVGWTALSSGLTRLLSTRRSSAHERVPRILAIVPEGPDRLLIQAISEDAGWALTLSENVTGATSGRQSDAAPIIIFDRVLAPEQWQESIRVLTKKSPRPYVILLSPSADSNLWDELQHVGGCDILRTPVNRDKLFGALKRGWQLWRGQQEVRSQLHRV